MNRRKFLLHSAIATTLPLLQPGLARAKSGQAISPNRQGHQRITLSRELWQTLDQLQQHLLPDNSGLPPSLIRSIASRQSPNAGQERSPGAKQINALNYLRGVIDDPKMDPANKRLIRDGAKNLQRFTLSTTKKPFHRLTGGEREKVLREFEKTAGGRRFLGKMLEYLIEALLGSPVYGGNTNQIGWKWLNHNPGFPLPPKNKRYFLL